MEKILVVGLTLAVIALGIWVWRYKRQTEHLLGQMSLLEQEDTNYRLSSYCRVGKTEVLIEELNRILEMNRIRVAMLRKGNLSYRESIISISHDIRTPLTSAKGYLQMLNKSRTEETKQRAYLENIEQGIDDVTDMLSQLFEYARIEANEIEFQEEKINIGNLFADVLSMFYGEFMSRDCEPFIDIEQTPCYICADKHGVRRIMENLIKNALVHGNGGYRFILAQKGDDIEIVVSNRTDSIEEEDMERIFDRFYTTDRSRTRKTTGMGLAIVKGFTEKMGGKAYAGLDDGMFTIKIIFPKVSGEKCEEGSQANILHTEECLW